MLLVGLERLSAVMQDLFRQVGERHGISGLQAQVLYAIYRWKEGKVGRLASLFNLSPATVSTSISKLEQVGLIAKPGNRRGRQGGRVVLTEAGRQVAEDIAGRLGKVAEYIGQSGKGEELVVSLQEIIRILWEKGITHGAGTCFTCQWFERRGEGFYCRYLRRELGARGLRFDCPEYTPADTGVL